MTEKWNVTEASEARLKVLSSFDTREQAINYAKKWIKRKSTPFLPFSGMDTFTETCYCWQRLIKCKKGWEVVGESLWVEKMEN
jgi:hypothetical protein